MQKLGLTTKLDSVKVNVELESSRRKKMILITAIALGTIAVVFAGLYLARFASVRNSQSIVVDFNDDFEGIAYDMGCFDADDVPKDDRVAFVDYFQDYVERCDGDEDCLRAGTRWSHVFLANGLLMIFIATNMICVAVGAYKHKARVVGAYYASCLWCAHFAIIIATGVYRLRPVGMACALNESATNAPTSDIEDANDDWTYKKDGALILALWIIQILSCQGCLVAAVYPLRSV